MAVTNMLDVKFREMRLEDVPDVAEIENSSFKDPFPPSLIKEFLAQDGLYSIVAELDGKVIGYILFTIAGGEADISDIAVKSEFRQMGVGKRLMLEALSLASNKNANKVFLEVRPSKEIARRLYTSLGFVEIGRRKRYYKDGEDAILMLKEMRCKT